MDRPRDTLLVDIAVGLLAGLVAAKATGLAQEALDRLTPEDVRGREGRLEVRRQAVPRDPPDPAPRGVGERARRGRRPAAETGR